MPNPSPARRKWLPLILCAAVALLVIVLTPADLWARAGGGGGYHGGGGGGGGGGYHGGGGGGGGSGGGSGWGGLIELIIWLVIHPACGVPLLILIVLLYFFSDRITGSTNAARPTQAMGQLERDTALQQLRAHDPHFDQAAFAARVHVAFDKIQAAWCNQDLTPVRPFVSDGVSERFTLQFQEQRAEGYRDHMADIRVDAIDLVSLHSPGLFDEVAVRIAAAARDWRQSLTDGSRISGSASVEPFVEIWTFLRRRGAVTQTSRAGLIEGNCPNCGAPIEMNQTAYCTNCKAQLRSGEYDWVLVEITQNSEWRLPRQERLPGVAAMRQRDPDFDTAAIEDRASVIYWRKATADRTGKIDPLRKVALPSFADDYAKALKVAPGNPRVFIADSAVGSVDTLGVMGDDQWDYTLVEVKWSGHPFAADPTGKNWPAGAERWGATIFSLARKAGVKSDPGKSIASAHCPNCGAPESADASNACPFCGTVLNDGSTTWVLERFADRDSPAGAELLARLRFVQQPEIG